MYLSARVGHVKTYKTMELVEKLFTVWLELHYFESSIKDTITHNLGYNDLLAGIL